MAVVFRLELKWLWSSDRYLNGCGCQTGTQMGVVFRQVLDWLWFSDKYLNGCGLQTGT